MSLPAITGDAAFMAFQEKLATVVTNARARGLRISRDTVEGCCCPLGAHPDALSGHPPSRFAQKEGWPEVPIESLRDFIGGYSGDEEVDGLDLRSPYAQLGARYRELYP